MDKRYATLVEPHHGTTGVWIVEEPEQGWIQALSPCCRQAVHNNDSWYCSNCRNELPVQPVDAPNTSIINNTAPLSVIRTWAAKWLAVPVDQIGVTR